MIVESSFKPAWWLKSSHLQTVWPSFSSKMRKLNLKLKLKRERIELPDGDFIELDWVGKETGPIVIVLHGLDGSSSSHYVQGLFNKILENGWRGVCLNFRGCSGIPNRLPKTYHAGYTDDLNYIVQLIRNREKKIPISIIGYSLGGSILLNWLAKEGVNAEIDKAIAISVPLDLNKVEKKVNQGFSRLYQWWFLYGLKNKILDKKNSSYRMSSIDVAKVLNSSSCREWDELVTVPLFGFHNVDEYYKKTSSRYYLKKIMKPTFIIQSKDDPLISNDAIPNEEEIPCSVTLEISHNGGHVGFISGSSPFKPVYWLEERIIEIIKPLYAK
jgi:predicted alpha/beta-fold hydrolase